VTRFFPTSAGTETREEFGAWGDGKTLLVALCAPTEDSAVCLDAEAQREDLDLQQPAYYRTFIARTRALTLRCQ